jgi:polyhydroxyalkanoate synthase
MFHTPLQEKILNYQRREISETSVFYSENKLRVLEIRSEKQSDQTPVLLIPAMINRYYILDLSEKNSVCKSLAEAGYPVFVTDWGEAGPEDRWQTFSDIFLKTLKRVITKITRHMGKKPVLFGYCMGGTLAAIYTSCFPGEIAGLIALTAPVDFSAAGVMSLWTSKKYLNPYKLVDALGNVPAETVQGGFVSLQPAKWFRKWETAWQKQDNEKFLDSFLDLEYWVNDNVPFAGGIWQEYITWLYQENRLYKDNLYIGPFKASLKNLACPLLTLVATDDHIVPPAAAEPLHNLAGSPDKEIKYFAGGHVGIISSSRLFPELTAAVNGWLEGHCRA